MALESKMNTNFEEINSLIKRETDRISGNIPFHTLFSSDFMKVYTNFNSISELLTQGGYENADSVKEIEAILDDKFDKYIEDNTKFSFWNEMYKKAGQEYVSKSSKL